MKKNKCFFNEKEDSNLKKIFEYKKIFRLILVLAVLFGFVPLAANLNAAEDVTNKLTNVSIEVKQDGNIINEGDVITSEKDISMKLSFNVPVLGDGVTDPVNKNDFAQFELAEGFNLVGGNFSTELKFGDIKVGTVNVSQDLGTKKIIADVVFDGDDEVFDGTWSNVFCEFTANMEYDSSSGGGEEGNHNVILLEKTFVVNVPPLPTDIIGEKSGVRDGQYIDWKIGVEAKKGTENVDLEGYTFSDNISNVGTYEPGTFKVGTLENGSDAQGVIPDFTTATTTLNYTFPQNSTTKRYVFFRTKIKDSVFFSNGSKTVTNTAVVKKGTETVWTDNANINFNVEWIKKAVLSSDNDTGVITWSITANQLEASLNNAVIVDNLDSKVEFQSATLQTWNSATGAWNSPTSITPTNGEYTLGNINTKVLLKITAKVKTDEYNIGHTIQTVGNSATLKWDGQSGIGSGNVNANIGINPIDKTTNTDNNDMQNHTMKWNVSVKKSDVSVDLRVLDLLVYQNSGFDLNGTYTITNNSGAALTQLNANDIKYLTPSYNQKYLAGSFESTDGLQLTLHHLEDTNGKRVADVLVVTAASGSGINVETENKGFSFKTQITNPTIYAGNTNTYLHNTASLFSANIILNRDRASNYYRIKTIFKDLLKAEYNNDVDTNKAEGTTNPQLGFNYQDKTVVYRIHVNPNKLDLTGDLTTEAGVNLGNIFVEDTLPDGWEFIDIQPGTKFLLYKGIGSSPSTGSIVPGALVTDLSILSSDFNTDKKAKFEFSTLDDQYVIYLKAKLTDEKAEEFFSTNGSYTQRNTVKISSENWTTGTTTYRDVRINSTILSKEASLTEAGEVTWKVEYKPYDIEHVGTEIEDTLPVGVDVRTDSSGQLDLTNDNIKVTELTLNVDGTYSDGSNVPLVLGTNIFYDNATRKLKFVIPQTDKAYRFSYVTDITGDQGDTVTNSVKLINGNTTVNPVVDEYIISEADARATMSRTGWIKITKKNNLGDPVEGVGFTIFASDGQTVIRQGTTDSSGYLYLRGLPVGEYKLKETGALAGYAPYTVVHDITVTKDGEEVTTVIDDKTGETANELTVLNRKVNIVGDLKITKTLVCQYICYT